MVQVIVAIATAVAVLGGLLLELSLRGFWGLGNPPIYVADDRVGYRLAPNQRTRRFGNRIEINQYSMRSPQISPVPAAATLRVLLLGDSVANGNWWTDTDETVSARMQRQLQPRLPESWQAIEVLNASANSWGPQNELAYVEKFGTFEASVVVLLINTDDLFATAPTSVPVGRDRNYPDRRPPLALVEVLQRLGPAREVPEMAQVQSEGGDRVGRNLAAIEQIQAIAHHSDSQFVLAMTPLLREIGDPGSRDYEIEARGRLLQLTQSRQIPYVDFLPIFQQRDRPETLYRDHIHLSPEGDRTVSEAIAAAVLEFLGDREIGG